MTGAAPDRDNTITPRAFAAALPTLCIGPMLRPDLKLRGKAGNQRLRAGLPAEWHVVDRTGTATGIRNNGAFAWPLPAQDALQRRIAGVLATRFD